MATDDFIYGRTVQSAVGPPAWFSAGLSIAWSNRANAYRLGIAPGIQDARFKLTEVFSHVRKIRSICVTAWLDHVGVNFQAAICITFIFDSVGQRRFRKPGWRGVGMRGRFVDAGCAGRVIDGDIHV